MASNEVTTRICLSDMPAEILLHICSWLDFKSLSRLKQTCRTLRDVSSDESLWKQNCKTEFLLDECKDHASWYELFRWYHLRFGRIHDPSVYRTIRRLWDRLEKYLQKNDPCMLQTLREPCDYSEISIAEQKMKCHFPPDLRCSLQIHNGQQSLDGIGICGCVAISTYVRSERLLDAASMARIYDEDGVLPGCVPLTHCYVSTISQYIGVKDVGGFTVGEVFYPTGEPDYLDTLSVDADIFISGRTYTEWFRELVEMLENNRFPRIYDRIFRFYEDPECVARTMDCFTVRASSCFVPDLSTINPNHFVHVYRITMSMDKDADPSLSCQLLTRHWTITHMNGYTDTVDGEGVVGEYPIMTPGASFSWVSCTTFPTTYGSMRGFFTMKNLETGNEIDIECPIFHMKCLPYKESSDRREALLQRKKNL